MVLHFHGMSPNPWKVAFVLQELGLPYELKAIDITKIKEEPFISLNPNGRVPALEDPNKGVVMWEVRFLGNRLKKKLACMYTTNADFEN